MNQLLSRITSLGKSGLKNLGFAQKAENVLTNGFDIFTATEISESDLVKIFSNKFTPGTLPFFIISTPEVNIAKTKFGSDDVEICHESDWFGLISPNDSSHIVIPSVNRWISFIANKQPIIRTVMKGEIWGLGGGTFQLDKNLGKEIIHTQVDIGSMLGILDKISHITT